MVKECIDKVDKRAKDLDNIHLFIQRILTAHLQVRTTVLGTRDTVLNETKSPSSKSLHCKRGKWGGRVHKETSNILC